MLNIRLTEIFREMAIFQSAFQIFIGRRPVKVVESQFGKEKHS